MRLKKCRRNWFCKKTRSYFLCWFWLEVLSWLNKRNLQLLSFLNRKSRVKSIYFFPLQLNDVLSYFEIKFVQKMNPFPAIDHLSNLTSTWHPIVCCSIVHCNFCGVMLVNASKKKKRKTLACNLKKIVDKKIPMWLSVLNFTSPSHTFRSEKRGK